MKFLLGPEQHSPTDFQEESKKIHLQGEMINFLQIIALVQKLTNNLEACKN